jgi:polygalacturonase
MIEDVTVSNLTMRGIVNAPLFLRLGKRMRGPAGRPIGTMRRILIRNVSSSGANLLPSVLAGLAGHPIEDVQLSDLFLHHVGGAPAEMAAIAPPENELGYPEATMFGDLPACGMFLRHMRNLDVSNVEVRVEAPDPRAAFWLDDVVDARFTRIRNPPTAPTFGGSGAADASRQ